MEGKKDFPSDYAAGDLLPSPVLSTRDLYQLLKEKLNLPDRVTSMSIDLKLGEPVTINTTSLAGGIEGAAIVEAVGNYQLVSVGAQIKPETLDQKLDRMADEAKAEIADMAAHALIDMELSRFSRAAAETARHIRMMSSPRFT